MANCKGECNKQMQGLVARLSQAEDNVANHFMGISNLVENMSTNIFTMPSALPSLPTYNSLPSGMELLQMLKDMIPDSDLMRQLMLAKAELLMDTLAATMDQIGGAMIAQATDLVSTAEGLVTSTTDALTAAIQSGDQIAIDAAKAANDLANINLNGAKLSLESITGFMTGQANISKCSTKSLIFGD